MNKAQIIRLNGDNEKKHHKLDHIKYRHDISGTTPKKLAKTLLNQ